MFNTLKNLKNKYYSSSTWGEFFASYLIDLDDIYERLKGKTEKQQIEILKKALEDQTKKTKELAGELAKQNEYIEELENKVKKLEKESENDGLLDLLIEANKQANKLGESIKQTQASIEIKVIKN